MSQHEAAFFDLDGTILSFQSEKAFALRLYQQGRLKLATLARILWIFTRYELGLLPNYDVLKRTVLLATIANLDYDELRAISRNFFEKAQIPHLRAEALQEIRRHQEAGRKIFIVSATIDFLVHDVADFLNIKSCHVTRLEVVNGVYTGSVLGDIHYGEVKANLLERLAVKENINLKQSFAYGDSIQDLAMLERVGHPTAVSPDRRLRREAAQRGWKIADWENMRV